jgi:hypothetical protein
VIVTVVAVAEAGAVTLIPKSTVPPCPATDRDESAIESVGAIGATLTVNVSVAAVELGPPAAACVAVTLWLALLKATVGVKLQAPLATGAVPATVPSIETVTVSPVTPSPEMIGLVVVVSTLPLTGLTTVGAGGGGGGAEILTVNVSATAAELGPPAAACVAVTVWLALLKGEVRA